MAADHIDQEARKQVCALIDVAAGFVALGLSWTEAWALRVDDVPVVHESLKAAREAHAA